MLLAMTLIEPLTVVDSPVASRMFPEFLSIIETPESTKILPPLLPSPTRSSILPLDPVLDAPDRKFKDPPVCKAALPACIVIVPPIPVLESPTRTFKFPAEPADDPISMLIEPDEPTEASPVLTAIEPDDPDNSALVDPMEILPPTAFELPLTTFIFPPVAKSPEPARISSAPPSCVDPV